MYTELENKTLHGKIVDQSFDKAFLYLMTTGAIETIFNITN